MVTTKRGMDPHSLDIERDGKHLGYIQWHPEREPHVIFTHGFTGLTLCEYESVLAAYHEYRRLPDPALAAAPAEGRVPGIMFGVSPDGGKTAVYWTRNVYDCLRHLEAHREAFRDYTVVAVWRTEGQHEDDGGGA